MVINYCTKIFKIEKKFQEDNTKLWVQELSIDNCKHFYRSLITKNLTSKYPGHEVNYVFLRKTQKICINNYDEILKNINKESSRYSCSLNPIRNVIPTQSHVILRY